MGTKACRKPEAQAPDTFARQVEPLLDVPVTGVPTPLLPTFPTPLLLVAPLLPVPLLLAPLLLVPLLPAPLLPVPPLPVPPPLEPAPLLELGPVDGPPAAAPPIETTQFAAPPSPTPAAPLSLPLQSGGWPGSEFESEQALAPTMASALTRASERRARMGSSGAHALHEAFPGLNAELRLRSRSFFEARVDFGHPRSSCEYRPARRGPTLTQPRGPS
jgi:hypothetical protein